jgi:hypothetical protein
MWLMVTDSAEWGACTHQHSDRLARPHPGRFARCGG